MYILRRPLLLLLLQLSSSGGLGTAGIVMMMGGIILLLLGNILDAPAGVLIFVLIVLCALASSDGRIASATLSGLYPSGGHPFPHPRYHLILLRGGGLFICTTA